MPDRPRPHPPLHRFRSPAFAFGLVAVLGLSAVAFGTLRHAPADAVVVDHIPFDGCVAFYGPGPCREHGQTITGSTDAIAGPPPPGFDPARASRRR